MKRVQQAAEQLGIGVGDARARRKVHEDDVSLVERCSDIERMRWSVR